MKLWQIIMVIISIAVIIYIWYPKWFGKKERPVEEPIEMKEQCPMEMEMFGMDIEPDMEPDMGLPEIQHAPPHAASSTAQRDFKVTITWIVATLNGLMLLVTQIKKIIK